MFTIPRLAPPPALLFCRSSCLPHPAPLRLLRPRHLSSSPLLRSSPSSPSRTSTSTSPSSTCGAYFSPSSASPSSTSQTLWRPPSSPSLPSLRPSSDLPHIFACPPPTHTVPSTSWRSLPPLTLPRLLAHYKSLSKARLTFLVVLTAMAGYALCPVSPSSPPLIYDLLDLPTPTPTQLGVQVLLSTALGTALCSASANALNQLLESPVDAQMARTRTRPLVVRAVSPLHAAGFALVAGLAGVGVLWAGVNGTTAALGAANIGLYAGVYTPLKRLHVVNTWVGSLVGGIPPLMGWTACTGSIFPSSSTSPSPPTFSSSLSSSSSSCPTTALQSFSASLSPYRPTLALLSLPLLLYTWQFPHFFALSHLLRPQYASAGYSMLSVSSPVHAARVSLRHALALLPLCSIGFPWAGLTDWGFAVSSAVVNVPFAWMAVRFWREVKGGGVGEQSARRLFHASLLQLPLVLGLAMWHKRKAVDGGVDAEVRAEA